MNPNAKRPRKRGVQMLQRLSLGELPERTQIFVPGSTPIFEASLGAVRNWMLLGQPIHPTGRSQLMEL
jgi:hypothetical protein